MPCIRKIVRASSVEDQNAVIALLQLAGAQGWVVQWLNNCVGGSGRRLVETLLKNVVGAPTP
jgi:hypothetical protein